jgi:hypothetical protein
MKSLVLLALVLFVTKKVAEFVLSVFCVLLFGYGSYVLLRDLSEPEFPRSDAPSLTPNGSIGDHRGSHLLMSLAR